MGDATFSVSQKPAEILHDSFHCVQYNTAYDGFNPGAGTNMNVSAADPSPDGSCQSANQDDSTSCSFPKAL